MAELYCHHIPWEDFVVLTAMLLLYCNFHLSKESDRLESYLLAIAAWALLLFTATEVLSVFEPIRFMPLLLFWLAADVMNSIICWQQKSDLKAHFYSSSFLFPPIFRRTTYCGELFILI